MGCCFPFHRYREHTVAPLRGIMDVLIEVFIGAPPRWLRRAARQMTSAETPAASDWATVRLRAQIRGDARGLAEGQEYRGGVLRGGSGTRSRTRPLRGKQPRQNSKAMLKVTAEQIGQEKLPLQVPADWSLKSAFWTGASPPNEEQNCPPTPLSSKPIICPCPKPQANTLNRTQKYRVQAMSERSERASFMAATLTPNNRKDEAQPGWPRNTIGTAPVT